MIVKVAQGIKNETFAAYQKYRAAYAELTNVGFLDVRQITNKDGLYTRKAKVKSLLEAADRFNDFHEHFAEHLQAHIRTNITDQSLLQLMDDKLLLQPFEYFLAKMPEMHETEVAVWKDYLKLLALLEDNWGSWTRKADSELPDFKENDGLLLQYGSIILDLEKLHAKQLKARNEVMREIAEWPGTNSQTKTSK